MHKIHNLAEDLIDLLINFIIQYLKTIKNFD